MKKFIAVAIIAMASFGASAGQLCDSVGEFGQAAAEARDAGVSKDLAITVSASQSSSADFNKMSKAIVEFAYAATDKTPEQVGHMSSLICLTTIGDK